MNVYVETNFILELALVQEQQESCERLLLLCESEKARVVIPAFCLAEPYETLVRRAKKRYQMHIDLQSELRQLGRSGPYREEIDAFGSITGLLVRSNEEENQRLTDVLRRMSTLASIISLESKVLLEAFIFQRTDELTAQDSLVFSSVLHHLSELSSEHSEASCFISRDRKAFDDPDIRKRLEDRGCKVLLSFDDGYAYVAHQVNAGP